MTYSSVGAQTGGEQRAEAIDVDAVAVSGTAWMSAPALRRILSVRS